MTGSRERRSKQLPNNFKEARGYWNFKEEALGRALWRTNFGRGYRPVVRQITK